MIALFISQIASESISEDLNGVLLCTIQSPPQTFSMLHLAPPCDIFLKKPCNSRETCRVPYSGLFWREKFFANSWHVRSNGNFGGKFFAVPLAKRSHAYLTRVRVTRVSSSEIENGRRHERELYSAVHDSGLSCVQGGLGCCCRRDSALPARGRQYSLSQSSSPPAPLGRLSPLYWQPRCWKQVPSLIADHRAVVIPTPRAESICRVPCQVRIICTCTFNRTCSPQQVTR